MEHLARIRTRLGRAGVAAVLAALLVPALAGTATAHVKHHRLAAAHAKHHKAKHHKAKHHNKHHKKKPKLPVITSVRPMHAAVGDTLTIRGHNFRRGLNKNTVIFMRTGGRPVFVKAAKGTTKMLRVTLPETLTDALATKGGVPVATRFRLRVLAARFGKAFTPRKHSPLIDPKKAPGTSTAPSPAAPQADCDGDGIPNATDTDDDNDLLPDTVEAVLKTDPCKVDTDGDGVSDGFEYRSALDLNDDEYQNKATVPQNDVLPYPGKRPYPNPLDPTDAVTDYDGDSLQLGEEYKLWQYTIANEGAPYDLEHLTYSDGTQYSLYYRDAQGRRHPAQPTATYDKHQQFVDWATAHGYLSILIYRGDTSHWYTTYDRANDPEYNAHDGLPTTSIFDVNLDGTDDDTSTDFDHDGYVSDDERDEDADGLSNYDETHGRMTAKYWATCYTQEAPYPVSYTGTDPTNPDTDGDGVLDGADDQDHDEIPNIMELSRIAAAAGTSAGTIDDRKKPLQADCTVDPNQLPKPPLGNHEDSYGWVNPFNPCLPSWWSRTCAKYRTVGVDYAPFADGTPDWWALN